MTMLKRFDLSWSMHRKYHEDGAYVEALEAQDKIHNLNYQLLRAKEELTEAHRDTWSAYKRCAHLETVSTITTALALTGWLGCIGILFAIITGH